MDATSRSPSSIFHTHYVQYPLTRLKTEGLKPCGEEVWLLHSFADDPLFNGSNVPSLVEYNGGRAANVVFGGVVTYEQSETIIPIEGNDTNVIVPLRVCIAGEVAGVVSSDKYVNTVVVVAPKRSKTDTQPNPVIYPPVRPQRAVPEAVLFVFPCGYTI